MTDIPVYNEKEISIKDISLCYKSDRRAQDVWGTSVLRRPFHGFRGMPALKRPKRSVDVERRQEAAPRVSGSASLL